MKQNALISAICCIATICLSACDKNIAPTDDDIVSVKYRIDDLILAEDANSQTRITLDANNKFVYTANDTMGIYPDQGSQVYFIVEPGAEAGEMVFNGGGWSFKGGSTYNSYYPFIGDIYLDRTNIPVTFTGQKQNGTTDMLSFGSHHYMYSNPTSAAGGSLSFGMHHLNCIIRPNLTLPAGTYTKLAITAPTNVFVKKGHYNLGAGDCAIVGDEFSNQIQIDLQNITLTQQTTFRVYLTSAPVNLKGVEITVSVLDSQKKERQCKKTPSANYTAGTLAGLTCNSWTEVPQNMGMIIQNWGDGGNVSGDAD